MPRLRQPPRLWLRPAARDRAPIWIVLDQGKHIATGFGEERTEEAHRFLKEYIEHNSGTVLARPTRFVPRIVARIERPPQDDVVYFVSAADVPGYPIKIGCSTIASLKSRIMSIQIAMPFETVILRAVYGGVRLEKEMHDRFDHLWIRGEWFRRGAELLDHIEATRAIDIGPTKIAVSVAVKKYAAENAA